MSKHLIKKKSKRLVIFTYLIIHRPENFSCVCVLCTYYYMFYSNKSNFTSNMLCVIILRVATNTISELFQLIYLELQRKEQFGAATKYDHERERKGIIKSVLFYCSCNTFVMFRVRCPGLLQISVLPLYSDSDTHSNTQIIPLLT